MRISEVSLGRRVEYNFNDIFASVESNEGKLKIRLRRDRPVETGKSGIYVWFHPDFGHFYVGIAGSNNFTERWNKHIQKLLNQCSSAKQMKNWAKFSNEFISRGYGIDDLKDITLKFYPIADTSMLDRKVFKKDLERLEGRLITMLNPACNSQFKADKKSSTRYPEVRTNNAY